MSRQAEDISTEIAELMRKSGKDVVTMKWPAFYEFCERERLKGSFWEELKKALAEDSILLVDGHAVAAFVKDFDFSPLKHK